MALLDDGLKGAVPSILVVLGVALAAPIVLPAVAAVSRPLAKTLIKGYLALADTVKEYAAEAGEQISDLMAECQAERSAAATAATAPKAESKPAG
ncbi:MAG: DUF5132 domain-containing protein [Thermodesulfobacteriota bacterium]